MHFSPFAAPRIDRRSKAQPWLPLALVIAVLTLGWSQPARAASLIGADPLDIGQYALFATAGLPDATAGQR